jgi:hypothetical protein
MVVMIDWENHTPVETVAALGQMISTATGRAPVIYCGRYQLTAPHPVLNQWPLFLAAWNDHPICPPGWSEWLFHQYTNQASVHGIHGNVDRSVFAGTEDQLEEWWGRGTVEPAHSLIDDVVEAVADVVTDVSSVADTVEDAVEDTVKSVTRKKKS